MSTPVAARKRYADWPTRLEATIEAARFKPFHWETRNCATFAADCVAAMTGEILHPQFAGLHATFSAAHRNAKKLRTLTGHVLGAEPIRPAFAQRGDVMLVEWDGTSALGICTGRQVVCLAPEGLAFMHLGAATCAWRV